MSHILHKEFGNDAYMKKEYREAIGHYTLAIGAARAEMFDCSCRDVTIESKLASYYSNRAAAHTMIQQLDEALVDCDAAIKVDPTFSKAFLRKAKLQLSKGRLEDALATYQEALKHDPTLQDKVMAERNNILVVEQKYKAAKDLVSKICSGGLLAGDDEISKVLVDMEIVLPVCADWLDVQVTHAELLVGSGKIDEAYELTNKLMVQGMEQDTDLLILRARIFFSRGNMDDATKHFRRALSGDPDNQRAAKLLKTLRAVVKTKEEADAAYKCRNYYEALTLYSKSLTLCPDDSPAYKAKLYFNRASTQAALGRHEKAISDCTDAIDHDSKYVKAYMRRAESALLIDMGDRRKFCELAVQDYEKALEHSSTPSQTRDISRKLRAASIELNKAKRKDLYKILGLTSRASVSDIKKAYRRQALAWHPDRHNNSSEEEKKKAEVIFREINLAYEVLSDPVKKSCYDDGYADQDCFDDHQDPAKDDHADGSSSSGVYGPKSGGGAAGIRPDVLFEMYMSQSSSD